MYITGQIINHYVATCHTTEEPMRHHHRARGQTCIRREK